MIPTITEKKKSPPGFHRPLVKPHPFDLGMSLKLPIGENMFDYFQIDFAPKIVQKLNELAKTHTILHWQVIYAYGTHTLFVQYEGKT